jgi:hypothetical protein
MTHDPDEIVLWVAAALAGTGAVMAVVVIAWVWF